MDRAGDFAVAIHTAAGGTAVATVQGELDLATSPELERALADVSVEDRLVIDLSTCTFLDSSAIRVLSSRARAAGNAGGSVAVVVPDSGIRRVLEIASLDRVLELHDARDSALG